MCSTKILWIWKIFFSARGPFLLHSYESHIYKEETQYIRGIQGFPPIIQTSQSIHAISGRMRCLPRTKLVSSIT